MSQNNYLSIDLPTEIKHNILRLQNVILVADPTFKPYPYDKLHLTLLFMGTKMAHWKEDKLIKFETFVTNILQSNKLSIQFDSPVVIKFPPGKENLFVIKYKPSKDCQTLFASLHNTLDHECEFDTWMPHITLGKTSKQKSDPKLECFGHGFIGTKILLSGKQRHNRDIEWTI